MKRRSQSESVRSERSSARTLRAIISRTASRGRFPRSLQCSKTSRSDAFSDPETNLSAKSLNRSLKTSSKICRMSGSPIGE